jgi:hypothetical protein
MDGPGKDWIDRYVSVKLLIHLALLVAAVWGLAAC